MDVFYGNDSGWRKVGERSSRKCRCNLTVIVSRDNGATWSPSTYRYDLCSHKSKGKSQRCHSITAQSQFLCLQVALPCITVRWYDRCNHELARALTRTIHNQPSPSVFLSDGPRLAAHSCRGVLVSMNLWWLHNGVLLLLVFIFVFLSYSVALGVWLGWNSEAVCDSKYDALWVRGVCRCVCAPYERLMM